MKNIKRFLSAALAAVITTASVSGLLVTPTFAEETTTTYGDFKVTTSDGKCSYDNNVLTLSGTGDSERATYTIEMADGVTSTSTDSIVISGWAAVTLKDINITSSDTSPITVSYLSTLILSGDNVLTAENSSYSAAINFTNSSGTLYIRGSDDGTSSTLKATGGNYSAAIGGSSESNCGDIYFSSVGGDYSITAIGGTQGAGIGSGSKGSVGTITIYNGTITATGGRQGAGIGSGNGGSHSSIYLGGGTITANGGDYGAGIGSGNNDSGGLIHTSSSSSSNLTVTATGGYYGAGIGGGYASAGNVSISNGIITAVGGSDAAAIGGGRSSLYNYGDGSVNIKGGYFDLTIDRVNTSLTQRCLYLGSGYNGSASVSITGGYFKSGSVHGKSTAGNVYSHSAPASYIVVNNTDTSTKSTYPYAVTYLSGLEVTANPSKTTYIEGQSFDSSGMAVSAVYANGCTEEVTTYTCSPETLSTEDTEVYVIYDGYYSSVYATVPVTVSEKEVASIAVTTQPAKTDYVVGQSFDPSGMVITATYTDGSTAKVDNDLLTYIYSESDDDYFQYAGTTEYITVSYGGKAANTTAFNVEDKTITGLSVTTYPDKVSYYVGETFDSSGMKVTASYNDGSSAVISDYTISPETITSGTTAVTVSKGGYSDGVKITVSENAVVGIEVTEQPDKTSYTEGDSFDPSGMTVIATYADGSEEEITDYSYSSINGTGSVLVYITYGSFYDTVTVNVEEAEVVTMTGITVSSSPTKTTYVAGENFDKSGMVIEAVYSDGSSTEIIDYSYSPTTLSESDTSVIVTYGNFYTTIPISVSAKEITKIEVTTAPSKTEYVQGEVFNPTGMIISATYSDGTTADLASSEYSYSAEALTTLGNIDFEISAANCTATTPITVIEKEISSISVTQYPDKVSYYDGQNFDDSGMVVQAVYNDGSTAVISDYTVSPTVLTSGDTEVTVSKDGFSDVVKITVSEKALSKIAVTSQPSVISYIAGETFNSSGMTVTAYYNDNSSETITDYTITNSIMTAGTDTVYITYGGLYTTVSVSVTEKTVTGIEVSEQPSKTSYIAGEAFDTSGMVINLNYSDGSYEEITNYNYSPVTLSTGDTSVLITYGNYFATVPVSVAAKEITSIEVETYPDKVTYIEGEVFDDSGMIVLATYNDGSTSYLASNEYTYSHVNLILK